MRRHGPRRGFASVARFRPRRARPRLDARARVSYPRDVEGSERPRIIDAWARGLLLALVGLVFGTMAVLLFGAPPCASSRCAASSPASQAAPGDDEVGAPRPGDVSVDDSWGALGP